VNMARRLALEEGLMVINLNDFKSVIVDTSVGFLSLTASLDGIHTLMHRAMFKFLGCELDFFELWLQFLSS